MGNLFRTIKSDNLNFVAETVKYLAISPNFYKEMGEPLLYRKNQTWYFAFQGNKLAGLVCTDEKNILYTYTDVIYRNQGVFKRLYAMLPEREWKTVATKTSKPIFESLGFSVTKEFVNYFKMQKQTKHERQDSGNN